ncbi:MAG: hypothetical protein AAF806_17635 [Bacteroidota bacterium]
MKLAILLLIGLNSNVNAQQQINLLNAFQHYKIQASDDYSKLLFLIHEDQKQSLLEEAYLNKWEEAFLVVNEQEIYSIKARYHIFNDAFYVLFKGKSKVIYPHLIQGIVFKDRVFVSRKEMLDSGLKDGYYEVLSSGKKELLQKYSYRYKLNAKGNVKLGARQKDIYIQNSQGLVYKIDLTPKQIFDTFGENQSLARTYAKKNGLTLSKVADLKNLFEYYNRALMK